VRVLGIPGSLRAGSYNLALLHAAQEVAPVGMELEIGSLAGIPVYNPDIEAGGDPEPVVALKEAIRGADALLIATPEYNYSIPGGLKNAIDWASRPPRECVLDTKPIAIVGASTEIGGTAKAQQHLRESLLFPGAQPMPEPQLLVTRAQSKFDEEGRLIDAEVREDLRNVLSALVEWTRRVTEALASQRAAR
jgi:chromate reductase